jgi:excisionase family DNA binding protein
MTVPEAARFAGRNPETIRRWIRDGKLKSERIGTQHLVSRDDVVAILPAQPLELPLHWQNPDTGFMPPWEILVRNGRETH